MKPRISIKHISLSTVMLIILAVLLYMLFFCTLPAYRIAAETGKQLGEETGRKVGVYTGSLKGIQNGVEQSRNTAHTVDETAERLEKIAEATGKICLISETVTSDAAFGDSSDYEDKGVTAVFTLDLSKASVDVTGETSVVMTIPEPECHIYRNSDGKETATANGIIDESTRREAKQAALTRTEKLADMVCDKTFICSVSFASQKGGDVNE